MLVDWCVVDCTWINVLNSMKIIHQNIKVKKCLALDKLQKNCVDYKRF